ncbi:DUF4245 family protein [Microbacterium gorillae]|uniref:DUF4245 family protein n=1 Tax=Microbacterium gorillae TaxID=1231063 RepID=UPI00058EAB5A|nr:DUF4245 family protein [Microbacterium gorillae]
MASGPSGRIVAELGRPETPAETAARKAESSAAYRSSQTFRALIGALLVTIAIVVVIIAIVPRGDLAAAPAKDPVAIAERATADRDRPVVAVEPLTGWQVNVAELGDDLPQSWTVTYAPDKDSDIAGFVTLNQVFDTTDAIVGTVVSGARADGTVVVDGVTWTKYRIPDTADSKNVTNALGTQAGPDYVLLFGAASMKNIERYAANLAPQLVTLEAAKQ